VESKDIVNDKRRAHDAPKDFRTQNGGRGRGARKYPAGNSGGILTRRTVCLPSSTEIIIYKRNGKFILDETDSLIN